MVNILGCMKQIHHSMFEEQIQEAVKRGEIRPISAMHLMPLMISNVQFLFISKAMHMRMWHMSEADFDAFVSKHKDLVIDLITSYLFEFEKV
jgi:TetR/AcrR family transcriptional regulator